jgi:hypothetical protein
MRHLITLSLVGLLLSLFTPDKSKAQTGQLLGGNVLNGALTGTVLGAATMGLRNSGDIAPLRVGLGSGILGGAGLALYDIATLPSGQHFFISGVFNDGNNSSIIILIDTFYGAAGGAILGSAIMLIGNKPIVGGLQYGSGVGAWAGFGFGLLDSFVFAERNRDFISSGFLEKDSIIEFSLSKFDVGLIKPGLFSYYDLSGKTQSIQFVPTLNLLSLTKTF